MQKSQSSSLDEDPLGAEDEKSINFADDVSVMPFNHTVDDFEVAVDPSFPTCPEEDTHSTNSIKEKMISIVSQSKPIQIAMNGKLAELGRSLSPNTPPEGGFTLGSLGSKGKMLFGVSKEETMIGEEKYFEMRSITNSSPKPE
ncbi:hypothetical protein Ciccas_002655 [Cichlidogyrus casuarinus]|uniref:Uncharacterized protein n=1 Tax=Cichlidogyrus casuarinus TaxID=1844966 RepID=A0ABD2QGN2_9PLAT